MSRVAYQSKADGNAARWKRPEFDKMMIEARADLDDAGTTEIYTSMALMLRDEGGLIVPMFNDFIDASTTRLEGQLTDPSAPLSNALLICRAWFAS